MNGEHIESPSPPVEHGRNGIQTDAGLFVHGLKLKFDCCAAARFLLGCLPLLSVLFLAALLGKECFAQGPPLDQLFFPGLPPDDQGALASRDKGGSNVVTVLAYGEEPDLLGAVAALQGEQRVPEDQRDPSKTCQVNRKQSQSSAGQTLRINWFPAAALLGASTVLQTQPAISIVEAAEVGAAPYASTQTVRGGGTESSPCLTDANIEVTATPPRITSTQSSVLRWSVGLPSGCSAVQVRFNGEPVAKSGTRSVTPPITTTYTVLVSDTHGQTSASTTVHLVYPPRVVIDPSTTNPVGVLLGALSDSTNGTQVIELCDVDLDLTGSTNIEIRDNRSLIASPDCERAPRRLGPRIFVTDHRGSDPLFTISGDNVRVSGFRLEGPTSGIGQSNLKERGIDILPSASAAPIRHIEISNMEIFHWSGAGVRVDDNTELAERGRLFNTNPGAVRVGGSYLHHNRHGEGEGYGVDSSHGAYLTIEQDVFDENRHAIAGGVSKNANGKDYSGYTARENLILSGGGLHSSQGWWCAFTAWRGPWCKWHTHQIDMHGDQNEWYSKHNWECGTAGETIVIERNTVLYTRGLAIKIRGNPADKAVVDGNVFKHRSRGGAIAQNGKCGGKITNAIDVRRHNIFGVDPTKDLGRCDFVGDGQQDQFMTTGVTWWAKSPVTQQWRYLNTMPERLSALQLGDFDGDGVCDVAPRTRPGERPTKYSKSGTSLWIPLP